MIGFPRSFIVSVCEVTQKVQREREREREYNTPVALSSLIEEFVDFSFSFLFILLIWWWIMICFGQIRWTYILGFGYYL